MNNTVNKITFEKVFVTLVIISFCAACILTIFPVNVVRLVQMFATVVFFVIMLIYFKNHSGIRNIRTGIILYYILILTYWGVGYSDASSGNYFYQITFFISIIAAVYCTNKLTYKANIIIYYLVLLFVAIHFLHDVIIGETYQGYTMKELSELGSSVIATSFSTLALILFCISLLFVLNTKQRAIKIIHIVMLALTFYYIVFCGQRGSVAVLMLIALFLIINERFFHKTKNRKSGNVLFLVFIVGLILLFGDNLISFLIQISPSERLTDRFEDIQGTMQSGVSEGSFSGRLSLDIVSINSWLRNIFTFFFGIGDHRMEELMGFQGFAMSGVGGHSEFIDSLARYGIIGTSIISYLYYNICKYITNLFDDVTVRNQVKAILIVSVLIGLTKGMFFPEIGIGLFLLLPLSSIILNQNQQIL